MNKLEIEENQQLLTMSVFFYFCTYNLHELMQIVDQFAHN